MRRDEVLKRDCFQQRMQQRVLSNRDLNDYSLRQYPKKNYAKKLNKNNEETRKGKQERLSSNRD